MLSWFSAIVDPVIKIVLGLSGPVISLLIYLLYRRQRTDAWLRDFGELHRAFWDDRAMVDIRLWLANAEAYAEIAPVLRIRRAIHDKELSAFALPKRDYAVLEKIDRFCNLMMRVSVLDPKFVRHADVWRRLFVQYWVDQIFTPEHAELSWYVKEFYPTLKTAWRPSSARKKLAEPWHRLLQHPKWRRSWG